ncbi:MAG: Gfo/Idh/MocA family oxidoreductase [Novosphingobium sp.]
MKVAVIGRGFGSAVMAPAYAALGLDVNVVSSRDAAAVRQACAEADFVSIHSPPFQHLEHVMLALEAGRDVLCDKPFGRNADEARAMRDAARAAGVLHFLNFEFRAQPAWARARALIREGAIGELTHVSWTSFGNGLRGRPHGWLNDAALAGGWIGAYGSHAIDAIRYFFDRDIIDCGGIARTEIVFRPDDQGNPVRSTAEDGFSCWFALEGGGTANVDSGYATPVNLPTSTVLIGSKAAIAIDDEATLRVIHPQGEPEVIDRLRAAIRRVDGPASPN